MAKKTVKQKVKAVVENFAPASVAPADPTTPTPVPPIENEPQVIPPLGVRSSAF